ncbi:MAG TPA: hypothetical protein VLB73_01955 [Patescibacteria group bacterium]|nr:hypothetical protein [Patescibacteria group bacterium]
MTEQITLQNTSISFVPSFSGSGWETSLVPRLERSHSEQPELRLTFGWIKQMLLKMQNIRREGGAASWTTAIARLFL